MEVPGTRTVARPQRKESAGRPERWTWLATVKSVLLRSETQYVMAGLAGALLLLSLLVPYWSITLHAPQYPGGLVVDVYAYKLTGDVSEVDGLNHYIGMMPLGDAARFERAIAPFAIPIVAILVVAALWIPGRWRWLAVAPAVLFPIVFFVDLFAWLYYAGHSLDPTAALSSTIKPFTPRILGEGTIGQFRTVANLGIGFYMAVVAAILAIATAYARGASRETQD